MTKKRRNLTRRDFLKATGVASASVMLASCGKTETPLAEPQATTAPTKVPPTPPPQPSATLIPTPTPVAGAPEQGGTLIEGRTYETTDLDPRTSLNTESGQIILARLYSTLVAPGPTLQPVAQLATSWSMPDDKTWEFKIRQGVKWSDGSDFTVEDVKYSYDMMLNPDNGHAAYRFVSDAESIEIVDSETVHFNMKIINTRFPNTQHWSYIIPQATQDQPEGFLKDHAIGTGPFMLESWTPDVEMVLAKNPYYFKPGLPHLDKIVMKIFPEEATSIAGLRTGEVDLVTLEDPNNFPLLINNPNLNLLMVPSDGAIVWNFNEDKEPMNDIKVRQAISAAINRQEVVHLIGGDLGVPSGLITPAFTDVCVPAEELPYFTYDPEQAKQLLAESSVGGGFKMDCLYINTLPLMKNGSQLFQKYMEDIGIEVELKGMETNLWIDTVVNTGDFFFTSNLRFGGPVPEAIIGNFACGSAIAGFYGPCSEEIDSMVAQAKQTSDPAAYKALWRDIQIKSAEFLPSGVPIYAPTIVVAAQKWVQGFVPFPDKQHRQWEDVWLMPRG